MRAYPWGAFSDAREFRPHRGPFLAGVFIAWAATATMIAGSLGPITLIGAPAARKLPGTPNIRIDTILVLIPVTVIDQSNRLVMGLPKEDFHLFEENREQNIISFTSEDAPVSIGLVFDSSGSMENKMAQSRAAVAQFLETANPEDEFFLVQFNNEARLAEPFTPLPEQIQKRVNSAQTKGATALLDALHLALRELKNARFPRKALLIISDGADNNSRYTESEIKDRIREGDVQIFAIGIFHPREPKFPAPEELAGPGLLSALAELTGGRHYSVKKLDDLSAIAARIGLALRHQYVLGYAPRNPPRAGKYRKVEVKLARPRAVEGLRAYWRRGYYGPAN